jgi:hypothetical protein
MRRSANRFGGIRFAIPPYALARVEQRVQNGIRLQIVRRGATGTTGSTGTSMPEAMTPM